MARVLAFAVSAAALVAPPTQQRRPVTARAVVSEPVPSSVSSKDTLVAAAEAFDLQGYFAKKVQAVEKALDASIQCTTPETKKIVESMSCLLYTSPSPRDRQKSRMPSSA